MHIVLDISRLIGLAWAGQPRGLDRVEFAHARHWRQLAAQDVTFVAQSPWGWFSALPDSLARGLLLEADTAVAPGKEGMITRFRAMAAAALSFKFWGMGRRDLAQRLVRRRDSVFLMVSHGALNDERGIGGLVKLGARFVPLLHDLIPITHPQFAAPIHTQQHSEGMALVARSAAGVMVSSQATGEALRRHLMRTQQPLPRMAMVGLGLNLPIPRTRLAPAAGQPYFVVVSAIEPRKNQLLLLQIWQEFARQGLTEAPRLLIIGHRPGKHDQLYDLLDRGDFGGLVEECGRLPDLEVARLVQGAAAMLCPSFVEGFGLPLAESLSLGTPVIASDIAAAREVGQGVPDYVHPLDFMGWRRAILDMATPHSPLRAAQLARLRDWQAPSWSRHFETTEDFLRQIAASHVTAFHRSA